MHILAFEKAGRGPKCFFDVKKPWFWGLALKAMGEGVRGRMAALGAEVQAPGSLGVREEVAEKGAQNNDGRVTHDTVTLV
jgi:hypothetical protein